MAEGRERGENGLKRQERKERAEGEGCRGGWTAGGGAGGALYHIYICTMYYILYFIYGGERAQDAVRRGPRCWGAGKPWLVNDRLYIHLYIYIYISINIYLYIYNRYRREQKRGLGGAGATRARTPARPLARTRLAAQPHAHSRRSGGRRGGEGRASRCASCGERRESSRGRNGWRERERERERERGEVEREGERAEEQGERRRGVL